MVKFSYSILLVDLIAVVILGLPALFLLGQDVFIPLLIGFLITTILAIASYFPFTRMSENSMNRYMSAMLIGMMIRMVFMGASVAIVFVFTELHQIAFTVGLLFSYICKSAIETYMLTRKQRGQRSAT